MRRTGFQIGPHMIAVILISLGAGIVYAGVVLGTGGPILGELDALISGLPDQICGQLPCGC